MLAGQEAWKIVLINIVLGVAWHLITLLLCIKIDTKNFDYHRLLYRGHKFEKNGNFYIKYFKIKKWKDRIPQYIGKEGFSKKNLDLKNMNDEYFDEFLIEICRAEWNHTVNILYVIVIFIIDPLIYAIIFSVIVLLVNLPCLLIQRYNLFRILSLKKRINKRTATNKL